MRLLVSSSPEKNVCFRSTNPGGCFVNLRFMFNGDRLAFVKG